MTQRLGVVRLTIFFLFILPTWESYAQDMPISKLAEYIKHRPQEKIYLHTNKDIYSPGETIWFKPYQLDGYTSKPVPLSQVLYVDVVDESGSIFTETKTNLVADKGGSIDLPDSLNSATYYLRAYTSYQLNFDNSLLYKKPFKIINELENPIVKQPMEIPFDITFYPEGGHLIHGLVNNIGFKAVNQAGLSAKITGKIIDQTGEVITSFESGHGGIGSFKLIPDTTMRYTAAIIYRNLLFEFPLPKIEPNGPLLTITPSLKTVTLKVLSADYELSDHYVLGYQQGGIFLNSTTAPNQNYIYAKFSTDGLQTGIAQLTLFNAIDQPIAERVCFIIKDSLNQIKIEDIQTQKTKTQVTAKTIPLDIPLKTASTTIYDKGLKNEFSDNIVSNLFLSSDLKGYIEDPYFYFKDYNTSKYQALDELMMTQGWTRFAWSEVLQDTLSPIIHYLEQSPTIKGQLFNYWNRDKTRQGDVSLTILENPFINISTLSSEDGYFQFGNLDFGDSVNVIIQAKRAGKKPKRNPTKEHNDGYYINIKNASRPKENKNVVLENDIWEDIGLTALELEAKYREIERAFSDDVIILDAFEIKRKKDQYATGIGNQALIYNKPTKRYNLDSLDMDPRIGAINMQDLIISLQIPGFTGSNLSSRGASTFTGSNQVAFFYNGRQVDQEFVLKELSPGDVGAIDYFTGNQASIFGAVGAAGVIAIYPRSKSSYLSTVDIVGVHNMKYIGFNVVKEFYKPTIEPEAKPDYRRALYWNPNNEINAQGQAIIDFITSDATGEFLIEIQGLDKEGKPVYGTYEFTVLD